MARHFARLKLGLLASAFRLGWQRAFGLVVGTVVGIPVAVSIAFALGSRADEAAGPPLLALTFAILAVGWTVGPLLVFGLDETLDPRRLRLLPLSGRQLVVGLTVAGAIGVAPVITLIVLSSSFAFVHGAAGLAVAGAAVAVHFLICLWAGRALSTALSAALRSRRGRDLATAAAAVVGLLAALAVQIPNLMSGVLGAESGRLDQVLAVLEGAARWAVLTPPGWAAGAVLAAGDGRFAAALALLIAAAALAAGLAVAWHAALDRNLSVPDTTASGEAKDDPLYPRVARFLPRGHLGAAVAKELRYLVRVPQSRMNFAFLAMFGVVVAAATLYVEALHRPLLVYSPAALGILQAMQSINMFGHDRGAVWLIVSSSSGFWNDLAGKALAPMVVTLAIVLPLTLLMAAVLDEWFHLLPAAAASVALLLSAYGVTTIFSVLSPFPLPQGATNLWGGTSGMGCATLVMQNLALIAVMSVLLPPAGAFAYAVATAPSLLPLVAVASIPYGISIWAGGVWIAAARLDERAPEFVAALSADVDR